MSYIGKATRLLQFHQPGNDKHKHQLLSLSLHYTKKVLLLWPERPQDALRATISYRVLEKHVGALQGQESV